MELQLWREREKTDEVITLGEDTEFRIRKPTQY